MANTQPVKVDEKTLNDAEKLWDNFIKFSKWGIALTAVTLLILAANFIHFSA